jgi:hypothetical protein
VEDWVGLIYGKLMGDGFCGSRTSRSLRRVIFVVLYVLFVGLNSAGRERREVRSVWHVVCLPVVASQNLIRLISLREPSAKPSQWILLFQRSDDDWVRGYLSRNWMDSRENMTILLCRILPSLLVFSSGLVLVISALSMTSPSYIAEYDIIMSNEHIVYNGFYKIFWILWIFWIPLINRAKHHLYQRIKFV